MLHKQDVFMLNIHTGTYCTHIQRCEILNHGIDGYEVWLHGRNQGRSGVNVVFYLFYVWCSGNQSLWTHICMTQ